MRFWKRNRLRIEQAKKDAARAEAHRQEVESRWPEIRRAAAFKPNADELTNQLVKILGGHA